MRYSMADRLRARCRQLELNARQVADLADVNRSFVYDIMRGRSENPNLDKLAKVAQAIAVERDWLLYGLGDVEGDSPIMELPTEAFATVPSLQISASMGGGNVVADDVEAGRPYQFQRTWIMHELGAEPDDLRVLQVEGDSMMPTLLHGDVVLIDMGWCSPTPPGLFVLFDGMGLVAKRLEHVPDTDPPLLRIISDNTLHSPYERTAEEVNIIGRIRWFAREI